MTSDEIRRQFIDFFVQKHGHTFVPSSPVVPHGDPTLLFTNAGMNQFKPIFLGQERSPYTRAVNTQKCIRAGGKHNDLDDVGRSRRHHTFFEMLGNWSFGDYFKHGAIAMAWELLTDVYKLDRRRLHVSCYIGDEKAGIPKDTEAADIWKQVAGLPDDHIHYFGKDNFWEMGDTGPCGPCTEIYYDRRPEEELSSPSPVNGDDPRVMEIWNNVFIQYNRDAAGKLTTLPAQHVDTGMGLERLCQVLQDKQDNYATDLWTPLFDAIARLSQLKYTGLFPKTNAADPVAEAANAQLRHDIAFRVVADHIRCLTFALTDGAVPGNEGRGYVLRRILRRAVFFGRVHLKLADHFLFKLVKVVVESMGETFPELSSNPRRVEELVKEEEIAFGKTLNRGIELFNEYAHEAEIVPAKAAFTLHDTYGFPIDLTRIMAEQRGLSVDVDGYEKLMEEAREKARKGGRDTSSQLPDPTPDALARLAAAGVKPTDDQAKYAQGDIQATIVAIWNGDDLGLSPADAFEDEELAILLDRTNFYAEMGGQVGDAGELRTGSGAIFDVAATRPVGGYILHVGRIRTGKIHAGDRLTASVSSQRQRTEKNHSATHLANWALREVLGDDVQQKGSLVDPEKLRFDFSHGKALSDEELAGVESLVNEKIGRKLRVYADVAPQAQAMQIHGLRAVFGEKYPPMVRVVSIGVPVNDLLANPHNPDWRQYSVEFCGGTHLGSVDRAGAFAITAEEAVSKGIRRLVALTGEAAAAARSAAEEASALVERSAQADAAAIPTFIASLQKATAGVIPLRAKRRAQAAIADLQARQKAADKAARAAGGSRLDVAVIASALLDRSDAVGAGKLIVAQLEDGGPEQILAVIDSLKKRAPSHGIVLASVNEGKVSIVAAVSDDLVAGGLKAGDWLRETVTHVGGKGGGRPQLAQGSGNDTAKLPEALAAARAFVSKFNG